MNFNISGGPELGYAMAKEANAIGQYKQRTLREQLQDRLARHQREMADVQEALDALTPDVEKALNALQKL